MNYKIGSIDYLKRARIQLDSKTCEGLFYAAFELRSGIEARMQEYLEGHKHISKRKKEEWRLGNLDKTILKYFGDTNRVTQVIVHQCEKPEDKIIVYYTPVTPELIKLGQKLGDLLHAQKTSIPKDSEFWDSTRSNLEKAYKLLKISNQGSLMGPPVFLNKKEGKVNMIANPESSEELSKMQSMMQKGKQMQFEIKHLDEFPT